MMIGKTISHYKILELIEEGGMGAVYQAKDLNLERVVALKFLPPRLNRNEEKKKRLIREAKANALLEHPNICTIHEVDFVDEQIFIAMVLYPGGTLKDKIVKGPLDISEAIEISLQIAAGLSCAHAANIIHRDLKPSNIMFDERGQVKIIDFGMSKIMGQEGLTRSGAMVGTAGYMSPEQAQGMRVDRRTDIWGLGILLYEMLTGKPPFETDFAQGVAYTILKKKPRPVSDIRSDVPESLATIVDTCLQKEPADRCQTADGLLSELSDLAGTETTDTGSIPYSPGLGWQSKRRRIYPWAGLAIITIFAIVLFSLLFSRATDKNERIPIAVVDFRNDTGEAVLDGLSGMLITALEQSRHLSVMTRSRMFDHLKPASLNNVGKIDEELGRQICRKANVKVMVVPTIQKFDDLYTIDLKLIDLTQEEYLLTTSLQAAKSGIPSAIDQLAGQIRNGLDELQEGIQLQNRAVAELTTPNLEAYRHYFKGEEFVNQLKWVEAEDEFLAAIALDSTFASAYYQLGYVRSWFREQLQSEAFEKAMALIDRLPERQQYLVRARVGKPGTRLALLKEMEKYYPDDKEMLFQIGDMAVHSGQDSLAAAYFEKVLALDPTVESALQHIIWAYSAMEDFSRTLEWAQQYQRINQIGGLNAIGDYHYALGQNDSAAFYFEKSLQIDSTHVYTLLSLSDVYWSMWHLEKYLDAAKLFVKHFGDAQAYSYLSRGYAAQGNFDAALQTLKLLRTRSPATNLDRSFARVYILMDNYHAAHQRLNHYYANPNVSEIDKKRGYGDLAGLNTYMGKYDEAIKHLEILEAFHKERQDMSGQASAQGYKSLLLLCKKTKTNKVWADLEKGSVVQRQIPAYSPYWRLMAYLAALEGKYEIAEKVSQKPSLGAERAWIQTVGYSLKGELENALFTLESVMANGPPHGRIFALYHVAEVLFASGHFDDALEKLTEMQRVYEPKMVRAIYYPRSIYMMARIHESKGEVKPAIENYRKFLQIWKDANEDLPELIEAKARLEVLAGTDTNITNLE